MNPWLVVVLIALASYRLTRLVTTDDLLASWRRAWFDRFPPDSHPLGQLVQCSWCAGWWCAGAVIAAVAWYRGLSLPLLVWPAVATVVGFLGQVDD